MNSTSTDVTITGAWCNRKVAKHQSCPSIAPADKWINGAPNLTHNPYYNFEAGAMRCSPLYSAYIALNFLHFKLDFFHRPLKNFTFEKIIIVQKLNQNKKQHSKL